MKKKYMNPMTAVYKFSIRDGILESASQAGSYTDKPDENWSGIDGEEGGEGTDFGRNNNNNSVWDEW